MNANIRSNTSRFSDITFPAGEIPISTGRNIGKVNLPFFIFRPLLNAFAKGNDTRMSTQLKDGIYLFICFLVILLKGVNIPWIENDRLLANDVGANS